MSTSKEKNTQKWQSLSVPRNFSNTPILINHREILVFSHFGIARTAFKYNINNNKWTEWFTYPSGIWMINAKASINEGKTQIFIHEWGSNN